MIFFIIQMIFFTTLWTLGWKIATAEDMILEKIGKWGEEQVDKGNKIFEGLIVCEWCVPNIHGVLFVWPICFGLGIMPDVVWWKFLLAYPFCLAGSSFASGMLWGFYLLKNDKSDYYESGVIYHEKSAAYYEKAEEEKFFDLKDRKEEYNKRKNNNNIPHDSFSEERKIN